MIPNVISRLNCCKEKNYCILIAKALLKVLIETLVHFNQQRLGSKAVKHVNN